MAGPAFVTGQQIASSAAGTSVGVTLPSNVTAGNMLVAVAASDDLTPPGATAITDNKGNTWTRIKAQAGNSGLDGSVSIYVAVNVAAGSTTVTFTNGTAFVALSVAEYTPNGQSTADTTAGANAHTTGTPDAGSLITNNADDLLAAGATDASAATTWSAGASWNLRGNVTSATNTTVALQDRTVSATGTYSSAFGNSATSSWAAAAMAIKAAVGGGATETFPVGYEGLHTIEIGRPAWL